jgi:hypothetical protein
MRQVVDQALKMSFEGLRRPEHERQATANSTRMPALEKHPGLLRIAVVPKLAKQHAVTPRPRRLQISRHKILEAQEAKNLNGVLIMRIRRGIPESN